MFLKTDFFSRHSRIRLRTSGALLAAALLAGCASLADFKIAPPTAASGPAARPAASAVSSAAPAPGNPSASPASGVPASASEPVVRMLAYADRVRAMSAAELGQEVTRLNPAVTPAEQLQLALVLSQQRQTQELIRAQELLTRLLANSDADAQALHPLARLLAARYGEQRRLEDQLDKQNQQTREVQRKLDQTNERLEALKAIERSLTSRSPAPPAPAGRSRTPAP
jgi:hypothetical protein